MNQSFEMKSESLSKKAPYKSLFLRRRIRKVSEKKLLSLFIKHEFFRQDLLLALIRSLYHVQVIEVN